MKIPIILLVFSFAISFLACTETNDDEPNTNETLLYELQFINAGLSGEIIQKEDLDFNELIEFFPDSTFTKKRMYLDSMSVANGSYLKIQIEDDSFFELSFDTESHLIQSCGRTLKENIAILNDIEIFNGGYLPCDGPGYGYRKIN